MKKETQQSQKNTGNHGGGVFASGRNRALEPKRATKHRRCQRKTENGLENGLASLWRRKRITKKALAGRGQEIKWEISINFKMRSLSPEFSAPIMP
jgi:hypothetical protein